MIGFLLLTIAVAACGGGGDGADPSSLAGTWSRTTGEGAQTYVLTDEGTFTFDEPSEHLEGTFEVAGDTIVFTAPEGTTTSTYYVSEDRFLVLAALLPDGEHDGIVGTWSGTYQAGDLGGTSTYTFGADGSIARESDGQIATGTYEDSGNGVCVGTFPETEEQPFTLDITFAMIDQAALAGSIFERVE